MPHGYYIRPGFYLPDCYANVGKMAAFWSLGCLDLIHEQSVARGEGLNLVTWYMVRLRRLFRSCSLVLSPGCLCQNCRLHFRNAKEDEASKGFGLFPKPSLTATDSLGLVLVSCVAVPSVDHKSCRSFRDGRWAERNRDSPAGRNG